MDLFSSDLVAGIVYQVQLSVVDFLGVSSDFAAHRLELVAATIPKVLSPLSRSLALCHSLSLSPCMTLGVCVLLDVSFALFMELVLEAAVM